MTQKSETESCYMEPVHWTNTARQTNDKAQKRVARVRIRQCMPGFRQTNMSELGCHLASYFTSAVTKPDTHDSHAPNYPIIVLFIIFWISWDNCMVFQTGCNNTVICGQAERCLIKQMSDLILQPVFALQFIQMFALCLRFVNCNLNRFHKIQINHINSGKGIQVPYLHFVVYF